MNNISVGENIVVALCTTYIIWIILKACRRLKK